MFGLLSKQEKGIIVFHVWKSLNYNLRMLLSFIMIISGLLIQLYMFYIFPGIILVVAGNLLLLVKGYNNLVTGAGYDANAKWEKIEKDKVDEILEMNAKIKKWDKSGLDFTNGLGGLIFLCLIIFSIVLICVFDKRFKFSAGIGINFAVLLIPHWVSGIRNILTIPKVIKRINLIKYLIQNLQEELSGCKIDYYILLGGKDNKLPMDIKFKINLPDQNKDFLGLFGQIVLNDIQGTYYTYFYTVLVAKKQYGMQGMTNNINLPDGIIKEFKIESDVEVLVIRQYTTTTSGYYTNENISKQICIEGLKIAKRVAKK